MGSSVDTTHIQQLLAVRQQLIDERRALVAESLANGDAPMLADAFSRLQAAIEAIDRALQDEEAGQSDGFPGLDGSDGMDTDALT